MNTVLLACAKLEAPAGAPGWLSAQEHERLTRMTAPQRRAQFLAARWLARTLLAHAAGGDPRDWRLSAPENAPPQVEGDARWHVAISHSADRAACAVGTDPVGVDLEVPKPGRDIGGLLAMCCTAREQQLFEGRDAAARAALFHELWTVKESWLKRRGEGVAPARLVRIDAHPAPEGEVRSWRGDGWVLALCAAGEAEWLQGAPQAGTTWRVVDS